MVTARGTYATEVQPAPLFSPTFSTPIFCAAAACKGGPAAPQGKSIKEESPTANAQALKDKAFGMLNDADINWNREKQAAYNRLWQDIVALEGQ